MQDKCRNMRRVFPTVIEALVLASLAGCATEPPPSEPVVLTFVHREPVMANLDYRNLEGSKGTVIQAGGFQHVLSVSGADETPPVTGEGMRERSKLPRQAQTVRFAFNRADLSGGERERLVQFLRGMDVNDIGQVAVTAHTDSTGSLSYNLELSRRRAAAVTSLLHGLGVPRDRIVATALGEALPVESNATAAGRAANRRATVEAAPAP